MPARQRGAAWAEERLLGPLRQSVPQNGRVHLHIIDPGTEAGTGTGLSCETVLNEAQKNPLQRNLGNGRNTVLRVLFRRRELTEPQ